MGGREFVSARAAGGAAEVTMSVRGGKGRVGEREEGRALSVAGEVVGGRPGGGGEGGRDVWEGEQPGMAVAA